MNFLESFDLLKKQLGINCNIQLSNCQNGYEIEKVESGYNIKYKNYNDAFKALLTIKSGVNKDNEKGCSCFNELGFMVDLSRNAILNMETIKKLIRNLALLGFNQLYLYMEDTYEVENQPYFGHLRGRYSLNELKEIDDYASSFGIETIPCIQTLAHMDGIFKWLAFNDVHDIDNIMLANEEKTYSLIKDMLSSLRKCFKTNKIHIGLDEAHNVGRGKYIDKFGYEDKLNIMTKHIKRVSEICKSYNFIPMMWSDMFFRIAFNGEYYGNNNFNEEVLKIIPKDIQLVYWDYYQIDKEKYDSMIEKHLLINKDIRFAGGAWKWTGFAPNNKFGQNASYKAIESLIDNNIQKVMVTSWGDNGGEASIFTVLPTLTLYSECAYRGKIDLNDNNLKNIFYALTNCSYDDFLDLDLPNQVEDIDISKRVINPSKYLLYNDLLLGAFDLKTKEVLNDNLKENGKKLHELALKNKEYDYIFVSLANLLDVLSIKARLGIKITEHYKSKDKKALLKDCEDISETIKRTKIFYNSFKYQWDKENKPQGFDVQDIRIGGTIFRMKAVRQKLINYVNGEIQEILELEEEKLPIFKDEYVCHNGYIRNVTNNIL